MPEPVNQPVPDTPVPGTEPTGTPPTPPAEPKATEPKAPAPLFEQTGDPGLDLALEFISGIGVGPDNPLVQHAQKTGDFAPLEAYLAAQGDKAKGFERYIGLAKGAYAKHAEAQKAYDEAISKSFDAGIPEEHREAVAKWLPTTATPEELESIEELKKHSPLAARAISTYLYQEYSKATNPEARPAPALKDDAGARPAAVGALSPQEYAREVAALAARVGSHRVEQSPEYAQLQARRRAFRG